MQFAKPFLPIIALATSITAFSFPQSASAETCLSGPKGAAPQGSHWKYRLERGTQRKCWRLVQVDRKGEAAAPATAQGDADEEADDTPPPVAKAPAAKPQAATLPAAKKRTEPVAAMPMTNQGWVTKEASESIENEPAAPPPVAHAPATATPADMALAPPSPQPSAPVEAASAAPAPMLAVEQQAPAPMPTADTANVESGGSFFTRFLLAAVATLGLLAFAAFYLMSLWRRRSDVLTKAQHLNDMPYEPAARDAPTFAPLPPMSLMPRETDDLDIAMERFSSNWRRRAA